MYDGEITFNREDTETHAGKGGIMNYKDWRELRNLDKDAINYYFKWDTVVGIELAGE